MAAQMKNLFGQSNGCAADGLPTALQIAESRADDSPLTTAIFRHLRGERVPVPQGAMPGGHMLVVPNPDETARAVAFDADFQLSEQELTALRDIQAFMDASIKASQPWALSNVSAIQQKQRDLIAEKMIAGESTDGLTVQSRDDINRVCLAHLNAADAARRRKTTNELLPLCKPILERFYIALEQMLRSIEQTDKATCMAFSLSYEPSLLWRACFYLATIYKPSARLGITSTWSTPANVLGGLFQ
jgi:hypothetical protein